MPKGSNRLKSVKTSCQCSEQPKIQRFQISSSELRSEREEPQPYQQPLEKLAVIIWNMITKRVPYKTDTQYEFLDQKRKRKVQEMKKFIHKFDITPNDLGLELNQQLVKR